MLKLRPNRSTSQMGLLEGLNSLQGAPLPAPSTSNASNVSNDPLASFSASAKGLFSDLSNTLAPSLETLNDTAKQSVTSVRRFISDEVPEDEEAPAQMTLSEEINTMFNLTMMQRIALFAMIFGTGVLLICMSFTFLPLIVVVPHKFAASFTLGNVLAIMSTWVLVGPKAQLQNMFNPVRAIASAVYLFSLVFTLFAAFFGGKLRYLLVIMAIVAEVASRKFAPSHGVPEMPFVPHCDWRCTDSVLFLPCANGSGLVCIKLYPVRETYDIQTGGINGAQKRKACGAVMFESAEGMRAVSCCVARQYLRLCQGISQDLERHGRNGGMETIHLLAAENKQHYNIQQKGIVERSFACRRLLEEHGTYEWFARTARERCASDARFDGSSSD
ncbi:Vesicle transport protein SFT2 [Gracilaria domingensis]|nr:Vesicle transport protein SFT2 [Gracilaria domingensis]